MNFAGKSAIITGGGRGLGKSHVLALAARGIKGILINDFVAPNDEAGKAQLEQLKNNIQKDFAKVKIEINTDSVCAEGAGKRMVDQAREAFDGDVHILINNAGIIRDKSFLKMSSKEWHDVVDVHLNGMFNITHALWPHLIKQEYGRIINTSSYSGIYGAFGQANYATCKMGVLGFTKTLALEGSKKNIRVNAIAPVAGTAMTETVMPKEAVDKLSPEYVSALVVYLAHEWCMETSQIFEVGGGHISKLRLQRSQGLNFKDLELMTPETLSQRWADMNVFINSDEVGQRDIYPKVFADTLKVISDNIGVDLNYKK